MNIEKILLREMEKAYKKDEIPVGCLIVKDGKVISKAHNTKQRKHLVINHAEILAITKASKKLRDWRLDDCELYVTLEPCKMCKEVIRQSRIKKVHYIIESNFNNEDKKLIEYKELKTPNKIKEEIREELSDFFDRKR